MTKGRFAEEFKEEAAKQVMERGYSVADVAKRLGVSVQSLYKWVKVSGPNATDRYEAELKEVRRENLKLKEFRVVLEKFKDPVTGEIPSIEGLKDKNDSMTQELGNKKAEAEGLRQKKTEVDNIVKANEGQIQSHIQKQKERAASFIRNGFEATITAVNNDWGFVIIDAGKDEGADRRRCPRGRGHRVTFGDGFRHQPKSRVGNERRAGIADQRQAFAAGKAGKQHRADLVGIVVVIDD